MEIFDYVVKACECLKDMKAENIIVIDTAKHGIAKYFVISTSYSPLLSYFNMRIRSSNNEHYKN